MNYKKVIEQLEKFEISKMKCFGNSMSPLIKSGTELFFTKKKEYEVGDIVFCKIKGRYIQAHKVIKKDVNKGYLIANNKGYENGWTNTIYGKAMI